MGDARFAAGPAAANPAPGLASRNGTAPATRRAFLGQGLAAAAWALSRPAAAQTVSPGPDGFFVFEAAPARLQLAEPPAGPAGIYAYAGMTPGPLLRLKKGDALKIRLVNKLTEPTSLSFPGLRMANANAGIGGLTEPLLKPGASAEISFIPPDSGFNLYLPRAGATDASQQWRGMFGPIIVEDAAKPDVDLDAAVVLSDWSLDERGEIKDDFADPALARGAGRKGSLVFANGGRSPLRLKAQPGARVRLRLGNAATAQTSRRSRSKAQSPSSSPSMASRASLSRRSPTSSRWVRARVSSLCSTCRARRAPKRALSCAGRRAKPAAHSFQSPPRANRSPRAPGRRGSPPIRSCRPRSRSKRQSASISPLPAAPASLSRSMASSFADWGPKPAFVTARGAPTVLALANKTEVVQAIRLWGHVARLLHSMDDGWEPYWRDTILIQPGRTAHVAFVADNPGKWPLELAIPEHRAAGVGTWFQVG